MSTKADIRVVDCGTGYHGLVNMSGNRAFYFLDGLRKARKTQRVQFIEGCILTNCSGVRSDRLDEIKDLAADAEIVLHIG